MRRLAVALVALLTLTSGSVPAQEAGAEPSPAPAGSLAPDTLPPLNLPDLRGGEEPDEFLLELERRSPQADPDPSADPGQTPPPPPMAAPPPPLPLPTGAPQIRNALPIGAPMWYSLHYDGVLVGYSRFKVERALQLGGTSSFVLKSASRIKIGVGSIQDLRFESELEVRKDTLTPSYFSCTQKGSAGSMRVNCVYSESLVAQRNEVGGTEQTHFHNFSGAPPRLIFNNLWGHLDTFAEHYWLLVRSAAQGGVLSAYDPILRGAGQVIVYAPTQERWDWGGRQVATRVYPITDLQGTLLARVRVLDRNMELLEVREVGSGLTFRRTTPAIQGKVARVAGLDLWTRKIQPSNLFFPDPEKLTSLEAELDLRLRGGQLAEHRAAGYQQSFSGEIREGAMKGRVKVRSSAPEAGPRSPFPRRGPLPEEIAPYLDPGPGVESDFSPLQTKALELTWKSDTAFQAARKLNSWVASEIEDGSSLPSARYALESKVGNSESKALLLVAMARAAGLPARRVGGLHFKRGDFVPHHWSEIWLGEPEGWTPFDPTTEEAGTLGASHIALWESGDLQSLTVEVKRYGPRSARKVPFFPSELAWPVGEERTYSILKDGQKIGTETARVRDLTLLDEEEVYRFEAEASLESPEQTFQASSELLLDPTGLPVRFRLTGPEGSKEDQDGALSFEPDRVVQRLPRAGQEPFERTIPFARGTYLTDQRFLSQWALVIGQIPRVQPGAEEEVGTRHSLHVFIPEDLRSREMLLEVREPETLTLPSGETIQARRLETEKGMVFLLNEAGQVVKIAIPGQGLEVVLEKTAFRID